MRTTVTIDDALLERVKQRALEQGKTLGDIFEASLVRYLALPQPPQRRPLPVFQGGGGVHPGIDETSNASMFAAADAEDEAGMARDVRVTG